MSRVTPELHAKTLQTVVGVKVDRVGKPRRLAEAKQHLCGGAMHMASRLCQPQETVVATIHSSRIENTEDVRRRFANDIDDSASAIEHVKHGQRGGSPEAQPEEERFLVRGMPQTQGKHRPLD